VQCNDGETVIVYEEMPNEKLFFRKKYTIWKNIKTDRACTQPRIRVRTIELKRIIWKRKMAVKDII